MSGQLPDPRLRKVYRLEVTRGEPLDFGEVAQGHRRNVPQTCGTFTGPEFSGRLLPGASAGWQIVLPDGTSFADIRSRRVRHRSAEVLDRLGRGEEVDASECTGRFRTSAQIETAAAQLDWLNEGVFVSVGTRQPKGVIYDTYLVE